MALVQLVFCAGKTRESFVQDCDYVMNASCSEVSVGFWWAAVIHGHGCMGMGVLRLDWRGMSTLHGCQF